MAYNIYKYTICCIIYLLHVVQPYTLEDVEIPENLNNINVFTDNDIAQFDGSDPDAPIYMAVKGVVFDVSSGASFYGPGASYNALTGRDCTRAVAKMSLDPDDLVSDISDLKESFLKSLDQTYNGVYAAKYPVVGYMDYLVQQWKQQRNEL